MNLAIRVTVDFLREQSEPEGMLPTISLPIYAFESAETVDATPQIIFIFS